MDHVAIKYLIKKKDAKPKLIKQVLLWKYFDLKIKDKKGTKNIITDKLSWLDPYK